MKKLFILIGLFIALNANAFEYTKVIPVSDTAYLFINQHYASGEDTIIFEPMSIPPGCAMVTMFWNTLISIYEGNNKDKVEKEFKKDKYKKKYCYDYCYIVTIGTTTFLIGKDMPESLIYYTILKNIKDEETAYNLVAFWHNK
jgi:undecaprenyl pyrophosphate phosphatase UppP